MRKLVFAINTSLDGCCDHTKFYPEEDTMDYFMHLMRETGTLLYGRKTYELMVPYWPEMAKNSSGDPDDIQFARAFDAVDRIVVFSQSLDKPEGEKTSIIRTGLREEVLKLKHEEGKNICTGGITLASQLAALNLIDEYHFVVHPIIVGEGRRAFEGINLQEKLKLKLAESKVFKSGAVALRYLKQ
jgi:dihydrofolate reductase